MKSAFTGRVYVVGDHIDTDAIIPARYLTTMRPDELGPHAMEDLDPKSYPVPFLNSDGSCDFKIIVAGDNFGCGSSREHAPIALKAVGIEAVVAHTFARIFYRNAVNGGLLLPLELQEYLPKTVQTGDEVRIDIDEGVLTDANGTQHKLNPFGSVKEIIDAGGLTQYNRRRLGLG